MKVKDLYTDESKWCKGNRAQNLFNDPVDPNSDNAVKWCLIGAIQRCYQSHTYLIFKKITWELGRDIPSWNDSPRRLFKDVKELVEKLDI